MDYPISLVKDRKPGAPCKACINVDRAGIDQQISEGLSYADIARNFNVGYRSIYMHARKGHVQQAIANKVSRSASLSMESVLDSVLVSRDRALSKADTAPTAYYAQTERTAIEANKLLSSVIVESKRIQLEQEKSLQSKLSNDIIKLTYAIDYMRKHHPDELESFSKALDNGIL
jgi:hypothetical protein